MNWLVQSAKRLSSRLGFGIPASGRIYPQINSDTYGLAPTAYPLRRHDGDMPLPALRLALIMESKHARNLRQSKLAAQLERDLQSVNHQMMAIYLGRAK